MQMLSKTGDELEGLDINFTMGLYQNTGEWSPGEGAHVHPYNECLVFFGHQVEDLNYLGAEITIELGKEHEKHTFDMPTVIAIPAGLPHFPVACNRIERPYSMMQVGLAGKYEESPA